MTVEEKKDFLKSYRNEYNKLRSLEDQKESIIADAVNAKAQTYSDSPKAGNRKTDISDILVRLDEVMQKIDIQIAECVAIKTRIESAILDLRDGNESIVMRERYINFRGWDKIADRLSYSVRQIYTFHGHALQHIDL